MNQLRLAGDVHRLRASSVKAEAAVQAPVVPQSKPARTMIEPSLRQETLDPAWPSITLNLANDAKAPISVAVDTGVGGQPQKRTQYLFAG